MAKAIQNMALSENPASASPSYPGAHVLLTFSRDPSSGGGVVPMHSHPFWQIDICLAGSFEFKLSHTSYSVSENGYVLVPPGVRHGFEYARDLVSFVSFRFECACDPCRDQVLLHADAEQENVLLKALVELARLSRGNLQALQPVLDTTMGAFLLARLPQDRRPPSSFEERVHAYLEQSGGVAVTVAELAEHFCYSEGHVAALYRNETGHSLKSAIDRHRVDVAERLLLYSDLLITQIADMLEFPDVFAFSRFYKRNTGLSPSAARKAVHGDL